MTIGSERGSVQNPFLRRAEEAGWTYLTPEQALDLRRGLTSTLYEGEATIVAVGRWSWKQT